MKPSLGGGWVWSLEDTEWILEKFARLRGSSDAFRAQDSDPSIRTMVFKCVELVFGASNIENPEMLRIEFCTSEIMNKKWSKRPRDPHNRIRLEKLCPKVVAVRKTAGRMPST